MHRVVASVLVLAFLFTIVGCGKGDGKLRARGRLLKGGEEYIPEEDEYIQITFVPIPEDPRELAKDYYWADVDQDTGTFAAAGKDRKGLPPGRYRVAVELMKKKKDLLGGKYDPEKSPFVFDIDPDSEEIVIDLDEPPTKV
jgi:hypothetical protein